MSDVNIRIEGFDRILFKKTELKRAIRKGGGVVRQEARRLIARRAISAPGDFPGRDSGAMMRSIKVKVGSGGGYAKVMPYKTPEMGNDFYPAFLNYGTSNGLRPRKNFMVAALDSKQMQIRREISNALRRALVAG
jgi:hypothetical protein